MTDDRVLEPFKDDNLVILKNPIANARFGLSVMQTKVLFEAIAFFKSNQDLRTMRLYIKEFLKNVGAETNNYEYIAKEIDQMTEIPLRIQRTTKKGRLDYLKVQLFSSADYKIDASGFGFVEIEISDKLKPYFLEIAEGEFFYYHILNTRVLKSKYSIKLYLFLKSWKRKGQVEISVMDLRALVEVEPNEYTEYRYFKKRIIESAKKELSEKCDITFEYQEIRAIPGNTKSEVVKIRFFIRENKETWNKFREKRELEIGKPEPVKRLLPNKSVSVPAMKIETVPQEIVQDSVIDKRIFELFRIFEPEAEDNEIGIYLEGIQADRARVLEVLLFAKQEKAKNITIKSIYSYIVYGLKNNIGVGLADKENKAKTKVAQTALNRQAQQLNKQIKQWFEIDFVYVYNQHLIEVGASADNEQKNDYVSHIQQLIADTPSLKFMYYNPDQTLKADELRRGLGAVLTTQRGETMESLFVEWVQKVKGIRIELFEGVWRQVSEPLF